MTWITPARDADYRALGQLMYHTVRNGALAYNVPQRAAWMPQVPAGPQWHARLSKMDVLIARSIFGPLGFVGMTRQGYVDFAYVSSTAQRRGIFWDLMQALTDRHPGSPMTTHASLHAQPAFAKLGFKVKHHGVIRRRGQRLHRAFMARF